MSLDTFLATVLGVILTVLCQYYISGSRIKKVPKVSGEWHSAWETLDRTYNKWVEDKIIIKHYFGYIKL